MSLWRWIVLKDFWKLVTHLCSYRTVTNQSYRYAKVSSFKWNSQIHFKSEVHLKTDQLTFTLWSKQTHQPQSQTRQTHTIILWTSIGKQSIYSDKACCIVWNYLLIQPPHPPLLFSGKYQMSATAAFKNTSRHKHFYADTQMIHYSYPYAHTHTPWVFQVIL